MASKSETGKQARKLMSKESPEIGRKEINSSRCNSENSFLPDSNSKGSIIFNHVLTLTQLKHTPAKDLAVGCGR